MQITIACDQPEREEFVAFLNGLGHDAKIGDTTADFIDGRCSFNDETVRDQMAELWLDYCYH